MPLICFPPTEWKAKKAFPEITLTIKHILLKSTALVIAKFRPEKQAFFHHIRYRESEYSGHCSFSHSHSLFADLFWIISEDDASLSSLRSTLAFLKSLLEQFSWKMEKNWDIAPHKQITSCMFTCLSESEVKLLSRVQLFGTPWTVAYQAPLSMGFSRQ